MLFHDAFARHPRFLMEGAMGERLRREFGIVFDEDVAMAGLVYEEVPRSRLSFLWNEYIDVARRHRLPFLATTPTRRANRDRVARSSFTDSILRDNVAFLRRIQRESPVEMYVGGLLGCRGDAYSAREALAEREAFEFHQWTVDRFSGSGVDFLYAGIMPALSEAAGLAGACAASEIPYIISFMIRKDGCLLDGTFLHDAIGHIDSCTARKPLCYMTNCVHPSIAFQALSQQRNKTDRVATRFRGIQGNASPLPPEALDNSDALLASSCGEYAEHVCLLDQLVDLKIVGGCCGTDAGYLDEVCRSI